MGGFHDLSWNLYRMPGGLRRPADRFARRGAAPAGQWAWEVPGDTATSLAAGREPYRRRLTLDFAAGDAVVIPGLRRCPGRLLRRQRPAGRQPAVRLAVSSYQGRRLGSILSNLSGTAVYLNQSRRVNWGFGAFRTKSR